FYKLLKPLFHVRTVQADVLVQHVVGSTKKFSFFAPERRNVLRHSVIVHWSVKSRTCNLAGQMSCFIVGVDVGHSCQRSVKVIVLRAHHLCLRLLDTTHFPLSISYAVGEKSVL